MADWTGKGDVGASMATGNSENQAASATLELKNKLDLWEHTLGFAGNYGNDDDETTAQRWEVRAQTQREITERAYAFGAARYEDDRFSNYDFQTSIAGGLGYKIIDTDKTKFWVQALLYNQDYSRRWTKHYVLLTQHQNSISALQSVIPTLLELFTSSQGRDFLRCES